MHQFLRTLAGMTAMAVAGAACGGEAASSDQGARTTSAPVLRPPTPSDSACPRDGRWRPCHLEDRINKAGMGIKVIDTLTVPYFAERGTRYRIGKTAKLVAFYFPDSLAGATATADLDRLHLTPPGDTLGAWPSAPYEAIRSVNLIAVLFEVNDTQAERVRLAITAGAPQPSGAMPALMPSPPNGSTAR